MRGEVKNIVKVGSMYAATIIGAGFASGQEISQFFSTYYQGGFYGILFASVMFSVIGIIVLDKVYRERIRDYDEFLFPVTGWLMGWVIETAVTLYMLSVYSVMTAGMATIVSKYLSVPFFVAAAFVSFICMTVILTDIKGVVAVNTVLTPLLVAGLLAAGIYVIVSKETAAFNVLGYLGKVTDNWFFSALLYVSYNSLMSVVVMTGLLPYLKSRRTGILGGVLGGMILGFLALLLNTAIFLFYPDIVGDLPLLELVQRYSDIFSTLYSVILFLAMFVSAVTSGYCVTGRISCKTGIPGRMTAILVCAVCVPLSALGFSSLISVLYPAFGYVGLFMVFLILFHEGKNIIRRFRPADGRLKRGNKSIWTGDEAGGLQPGIKNREK